MRLFFADKRGNANRSEATIKLSAALPAQEVRLEGSHQSSSAAEAQRQQKGDSEDLLPAALQLQNSVPIRASIQNPVQVPHEVETPSCPSQQDVVSSFFK